MNCSTITKVAMDAHKKQHQVAYCQPGMDQITEFRINNTVKDVKKMVKKIRKRVRDLFLARRLFYHQKLRRSKIFVE